MVFVVGIVFWLEWCFDGFYCGVELFEYGF